MRARAVVLAVGVLLAACGGEDEPASNQHSVSEPPPGGCCRVCTTGQACGDTCIGSSLTCHTPPGCACNNW